MESNGFHSFTGTIHVTLRAGSAYISKLYVAGSERRQGIGTLLMEDAIKVAKDFGCESIALTVSKENENIKFYDKFNFLRCYQYDDKSHLFCKVLNG